MSSRQLVRAAVVLVAALVLWGILAIARRSPSDALRTLALPKIDTASVDSVVVSQRADTARIVRVSHGVWHVNGFPTASDAVTALLRGLADTAASSEEIAENQVSQQRFGVGADSGTRVRVFSRGRAILDLVAGHRTSDFGGVYVRRTGDEPTYALHGSLVDPATRAISDWRDKHIVAVAPDSVATISVQRPGKKAYTLHRVGHAWRLDTGAPADSSAVQGLLNQYRDLSAMGFAAGHEADSVNFTRAPRRATLLRANGTPLTALQFDSTAGHVWVRKDTGSTVYELSTYLLGQLVPADSTVKAKAPTKK